MADRVAPAQSKKIRLFSDDRGFVTEATASLQLAPGYSVTAAPVAEFLSSGRGGQAADLIILDLGAGERLADPQLQTARHGVGNGTALLLVSQEIAGERLRDLVRLSGTDWMKKPIGRRELLDAVAKCLNSVVRVSARVSAFVSAVAGGGATTVATNAAYLAASHAQRQRSSHHCMLFELDFAAASIAGLLDIPNEFDFREVLDHPGRIDNEFVDIIRKEHPSGFSLLSIRAPILLSHPAGAEVVLRMLDVLSFQYSTVLIDVPYYDTPWRTAVLEGASDVVLVTECTIPALRRAREIDRWLGSIRPTETVTIVVNKLRTGLLANGLGRKDVEKVFAGRRIEVMPYAIDQVEEAANRGVVAIEHSPRSAFSKHAGKLLLPLVS